MTPLKYGDRVLSFPLNLYWNGGVDPRCGCKRPVKALFLSNCHCHNSKVSQQENSIFVFLPSCKFKLFDRSPRPTSGTVYTCCSAAFQLYTLGTFGLASDVVVEGEAWRAGGGRACDAHVCDLTTTGLKQH